MLQHVGYRRNTRETCVYMGLLRTQRSIAVKDKVSSFDDDRFFPHARRSEGGCFRCPCALGLFLIKELINLFFEKTSHTRRLASFPSEDKNKQHLTISKHYKLTLGCAPVHLARNFRQSCSVSRRMDFAVRTNLFQSSLFAISW